MEHNADKHFVFVVFFVILNLDKTLHFNSDLVEDRETNMAGDRQFHIADYVVFSLTMIISIAIGIYHARKRRSASTNDYMVGSRSMRSFPLALSMVVSFESAILVLGFPAEIYTHGIIFFWIIISVPLSHLIVYRIVPRVIYPLKITTIYEYFDLCFKSKAVRTLASILALVHQVIYMGVVLFGPAIALQAVVGFPFEWSIIVLASVSILYTSTGGFRAVIWTDVFQSGIMILGAIVVLIKGTIDAGGPAEIYEHNLKGERLTLFNFDLNPSVRHTTWCLLFGGLVKGLSFGLNQASIQRISSASDQRTSEKALLMCIPLYFITTLIPIAHGLIIYGYYSKIRCDPLANEEIENSNQIIALFVIDVFKSLPGLAGLFIAALFSACLSTLSSGLSVASAIIVDDYAIVIKPSLSDKTKTIIGRLVVLIFGLISVAVAFFISYVKGPLTQVVISLMASFLGPLSGLTLLAMLVPFANAKGAIAGVISGVLMTCWISFGSLSSSTLIKTPELPPTYVDQCIVDNNSTLPQNYTMAALDKIRIYENYEPEGLDRLYSLSYFWFDIVGILTVFIIGCVVSLITGPVKAEGVDSRLKYPVFDGFCCCLPESVRHHLRCGVKYQKEAKDDKYHVNDKDAENQEKAPFRIQQEEMEMDNCSRQPLNI